MEVSFFFCIFAAANKKIQLMSNQLSNLFVYGTATSGECFMDRENETARLKMNFSYGINTMLISPRRWGKTSLVKHVCEQMTDQNQVKMVQMDVFSCRTPEDFYATFATEIIRQTSTKTEELIENARRFLSGLIPKISFGPDPFHEVSFSLEPNSHPYTEEVLDLPEVIAKEKGINIYICIDEFQQIGEMTNSLSFQKKLRSHWQHHQHTHYCLYGSKRHLLMNMFCKYSYPFYHFGDTIFLQPIPTSYWITYIKQRFAISGKQVSDELCTQICDYVDNNSSYVQQLAWLLWTRTEQVANQQALEVAKEDLMQLNHFLFQNYVEPLSAYQIRLLRAIAHGNETQLSSQAIIQRYNLGSSANVDKLKKSLEDKELIEVGKNTIIADPLFKKWIVTHL